MAICRTPTHAPPQVGFPIGRLVTDRGINWICRTNSRDWGGINEVSYATENYLVQQSRWRWSYATDRAWPNELRGVVQEQCDLARRRSPHRQRGGALHVPLAQFRGRATRVGSAAGIGPPFCCRALLRGPGPFRLEPGGEVRRAGVFSRSASLLLALCAAFLFSAARVAS
jgi:hypothetical protein